MNGPITNHELGKAMHREYEAEASQYWRQTGTGEEQSAPARHRKLALVIVGISLAVGLVGQLLPL